MTPTFHIRQATTADVPTLQVLIDASVRGLQTQDHTPAQIEGALETAFGVDSQLLKDGTYFVVENVSTANHPIIVGCGGWSNRKTLFGNDHATNRDNALLDPRIDAAKIRAFLFIRIGRGAVLAACFFPLARLRPWQPVLRALRWAPRSPAFRCIRRRTTSNSNAFPFPLGMARLCRSSACGKAYKPRYGFEGLPAARTSSPEFFTTQVLLSVDSACSKWILVRPLNTLVVR